MLDLIRKRVGFNIDSVQVGDLIEHSSYLYLVTRTIGGEYVLVNLTTNFTCASKHTDTISGLIHEHFTSITDLRLIKGDSVIITYKEDKYCE